MNPRKCIWIINFNAVPPQYATMFRHICFARELGRLGYDVRIFGASMIHNTDIGIDTGGKAFLEKDYDGIKFVHIKTKRYHGNGLARMIELWRFPRKILSHAAEFPKPHAIIHSATVPFDTIVSKIARRFGAKYIVEIHDLWPAAFVAYGFIGPKNPLLSLLYREERRLYHLADELVFTMEGGKDYVREKGWDKARGRRVALEKIHNINQGVDLAAFEAEKNVRVADPDLDDADVFKVVYVGSIRLANNLSAVIDAAGLIKSRGFKKTRLIIYGDGDKREELEAYCRVQGLDNVVFKGRVKPQIVPGILARANLNIFNFGETPLLKYGASPNKLFLYFASGKPVLSTLTPNYDLVERYKAGRSVKNDPESIAEGIMSFVNLDPSTYSAYCVGASAAARDYDYPNLVKKLEAIL